jgi:hypothetical protein
MSPDTTPDDDATENESPDPEVMQRVASALEATEAGGSGPSITLAADKSAPLPPRRGS